MQTLTLRAKLLLSCLALCSLFFAPAIAFADDCANTTGAGGLVDNTKVQNCVTHTKFVSDLQTIVNFLSAGVGIIVIAVIILGGVQYSLAGDNAQAITAAKQRIFNGLIALVAYIFTFAFLQWLIPGGIFG